MNAKVIKDAKHSSKKNKKLKEIVIQNKNQYTSDESELNESVETLECVVNTKTKRIESKLNKQAESEKSNYDSESNLLPAKKARKRQKSKTITDINPIEGSGVNSLCNTLRKKTKKKGKQLEGSVSAGTSNLQSKNISKITVQNDEDSGSDYDFNALVTNKTDGKSKEEIEEESNKNFEEVKQQKKAEKEDRLEREKEYVERIAPKKLVVMVHMSDPKVTKDDLTKFLQKHKVFPIHVRMPRHEGGYKKNFAFVEVKHLTDYRKVLSLNGAFVRSGPIDTCFTCGKKGAARNLLVAEINAELELKRMEDPLFLQVDRRVYRYLHMKIENELKQKLKAKKLEQKLNKQSSGELDFIGGGDRHELSDDESSEELEFSE